MASPRDHATATSYVAVRESTRLVSECRDGVRATQVMSWLERLPESFGPAHKMKLLTLFDTYLGATCGMLRRTMHEPFPTVDGALLDSLLNLLDCEFFEFYPREGQENKTPEEVDQCAEHMEAIFFFAFIWSDSA